MNENELTDTIVVLSGGMDSATLLCMMEAEGRNSVALSVDYGQRHAKELRYAARLAAHCGVEHVVADLRAIAPLLAGSSLTSSDVAVPDGHYTDDTMRVTVVPNRNMLLLSVAIALAVSRKAVSVAYGCHAGDHTIYPDCRPGFVSQMAGAALLCSFEPIKVETPFIDMSKADVCGIGGRHQVPFADTWSCYKGGDIHCGTCGTCVERIEAFVLAGVDDPTEYAAP